MSALRSWGASVLAVLGTAVLIAASASAATGSPGAVRLPEFERVTLGNGAELALMPKRDTPLVAMNVVVRGGSLADAPGREGTAALLAELMQKGAGDRDGAQFAEAIESAGGQLVVGAGAEGLSLGASFLARDLGLMIELASDALLRPRLSASEFDKVRERAIQSIAAAKDADPRALVGEYGDAWLFRGHPYGRPVGGSEESLAAVTLDDLKRHYEAQVRGDRLIIAVVGDFDPADVRRRLEAAFGSLGRSAAAAPAATKAPAVEGRRVLLVDKPGAAQTYFWLGNVGASRTDPERTAQAVVNTVFGGRFTSMLNTELRIKSGLTYGARSGFDRLAQPGRSTSPRSPRPRAPCRRSTWHSPPSTGCTPTAWTPRRSSRREPTWSGSSRPRSRPTARSRPAWRTCCCTASARTTWTDLRPASRPWTRRWRSGRSGSPSRSRATSPSCWSGTPRASASRSASTGP
jgi:zinc protease